MRNFHAAALLAAALFSGLPCPAATPVSAAKTTEFHEAYAAFNSNDFAKAYKILTALVAQTPAYDAFGLLGQTEVSLGRYRDAAEHLTFAIQNTPAGKARDAVPVLTQDLIEAKMHVAVFRITVDQNDAAITIDGKIIGKSPLDTDVYVDPGKHTIKATHATFGTADSTVDAKMAQRSEVALHLTQPPPASTIDTSPPPLKYTPADLDKPSTHPAPVNPPPTVEAKHGIETRTIVLIAGGAVTLIAAGTATYFGLKAHSAKSDAEDLLKNAQNQFGPNPCSSPAGQGSQVCANVRDKWDNHNSAGRIYNIALPLAGVAAIATGVLYAVLPTRKHATSSRNLTLVPVADQRTGGFLLQGGF